MFLLNRDQILGALASPNFGLRIGRFEDSCLQHTAYYFRLGHAYEHRNERGDWIPGRLDVDKDLTLGPGETVRIESRESFRLGDRVLGMLGGTSSIARDGLLLLHGPFIDPLFPDEDISGRLEMALVNQTKYAQTVKFERRIGKVAFFDISDTYPIHVVEGSEAARLFQQRRDG